MEELLSGLVPGLPDDLQRQILERAEPDADDAEEIRSTAREMLVRAAERAASLAANAEAQSSFERAIELKDEPLVRAELHERAGLAARVGARADQAAEHFQRAIEL